MANDAHFKAYHWQQVLAGVLRALGCDRQLTRGIVGGIYGTYGRTEVLDMHNFVEWGAARQGTADGERGRSADHHVPR